MTGKFQSTKYDGPLFDAIANEWRDGLSSKELAKQYGISFSTVLRSIRSRGIVTSNRTSRKLLLNQDAFSIITPASAYWIGFLMADGCVGDNGTICLRLSTVDITHLEKFKSFTGASHKIVNLPEKRFENRNNGPASYIVFMSKKMALDLKTFGVVPRKSAVAVVSRLEMNRDFWRGFIDGDGWIGIREIKGKKYASISARASSEMAAQFKTFCSSIVDSERVGIYRDRTNNKMSEIKLFGKAAISIVEALYNNADDFLIRKANKARLIINLRQ